MFKIYPDSKRVENRLSFHCSSAFDKCTGLNRSRSKPQRVTQFGKVRKLAILNNDIISVEKWEASLTLMEQKMKEAKDEICNCQRIMKNNTSIMKFLN